MVDDIYELLCGREREREMVIEMNGGVYIV
jgi:hypothetical protein